MTIKIREVNVQFELAHFKCSPVRWFLFTLNNQWHWYPKVPSIGAWHFKSLILVFLLLFLLLLFFFFRPFVRNNLKAHVHSSGFARLSFCFGRVHLLNAVFWLAVISQRTISNYAKFPQCIQGEVVYKTAMIYLLLNLYSAVQTYEFHIHSFIQSSFTGILRIHIMTSSVLDLIAQLVRALYFAMIFLLLKSLKYKNNKMT